MKRVRAIIIKNKKVLTIKRTKINLVYWVIPGGAVEEEESNECALKREIKEELGINIEIKKLALEINSKKLETKGQREYFYICNIVDGIIGSGNGPEFQKNSDYIGKYNIEWLDIKKLNNFDLKPQEIKEIIKASIDN